MRGEGSGALRGEWGTGPGAIGLVSLVTSKGPGSWLARVIGSELPS